MYKNYRLYISKVIIKHVIDNICIEKPGEWIPTHKLFQARTREEANKKASKFLIASEIRVCQSICFEEKE